MIIKEIVLHNVGVYRGRHVIDFYSGTAERPITLLGALNGCGKTTIMESIKLGLYGELADLARRGRAGYQDYLQKMLNRHTSHSEGASIELLLDVKGKGEIRVERSWAKRRKSVKEYLAVWADGQPDDHLAANWAEEVERLFPQRLCGLFLFDGEQIEALADPAQTSGLLQTAISSLLGVDLIDQACKDLKVVERRNANTVADSRLVQARENVETEMEAVRKMADDLSRQLAEEGPILAACQADLARAEEQLTAQGGDLFGRAKSLEQDRAAITAKIQHLEEELRQLAAGSLPLRLLQDEVKDLAVLAEEDLAARHAGISLQEMQAFRQRVFSTLHSENLPGPAVGQLEALFGEEVDRLEAAATGAPNTGLDESDFQILAGVGDAIDEAKSRATQLLSRLADAKAELDAVDQQLAAVPDEGAIADLLEKRSELRARVRQLEGAQTDREQQLAHATNQQEELDAKLERLGEELAKSEDLDEKIKNRVGSSIRARKALSDLKVQMVAKHISSIRLQVLDCYHRLLRKEGLVDDIDIDPVDFTLRLFDADRAELPAERLSAGERQLLATAILWSLALLSGQKLPVIIDTPLGRLDSTHRMNLVQEYFPSASHQVILLSTDEEIDSRYYAALKPSIGREMTIRFDEVEKTSKVFDGYLVEEAA